MPSHNQSKGIFYAIVAAIMWGVLAIALKVTLQFLPSPSIVWIRFSIAFLLLFVYMAIKQPNSLSIFLKPPKKLIIASLCLAFNYFGYMKGLEYTSPGTAQVFIQLGPVLFAIAGIYIFKEKINWKHILGFIVIIAGLGLFYWEQISDMASQKMYSLGILWVIGAAVSWAVYAIYQKDLSHQTSTNQLNIFIYGFCTLLFVPFPKYSNFLNLGTGAWLLVIFLGINTLVAYGSIALAFRHLVSSKVSVIITMNPLLTFALMYIFSVANVSWIAPEHFSILSILGAAMALGGTIFVILFTRKE